MSVFSERLIQLRKEKKLSQAVVAKEIKTALRGYQSYEYGDAEPKLSILIRIADFFDVSLDYLAGRID